MDETKMKKNKQEEEEKEQEEPAVQQSTFCRPLAQQEEQRSGMNY